MLMGPPGSGKGTQAHEIQREWHLERIETGALLRSMRSDASHLGQTLRQYIDRGFLAPPPLVADLVIREMETWRAQGKGVIFDGSPRTLYEAERLLAALGADGRSRVIVLVLDVPKPETVHRVLRRFVCVNCRHPNAGGAATVTACLACGGTLQRRDDDTAEVMERRWEEYVFRTLPVIHFFGRKGLTIHVDGARPIPDVWTSVQRVVAEQLAA